MNYESVKRSAKIKSVTEGLASLRSHVLTANRVSPVRPMAMASLRQFSSSAIDTDDSDFENDDEG